MDQKRSNSLDTLSKAVAKAAGLDEDEIDRIVSSPFVNARLMAKIEAERKRRLEPAGNWFGALFVAARAITVLLVVAVASVLAFWFSKANVATTNKPIITGENNISRVLTGGTCALSSTQECAISREEVLATLLTDKEQEILR